MATITLRGNPIQTSGELPKPGVDAPRLPPGRQRAQGCEPPRLRRSKNKVLNIFPSVDTPTCATSVRKFNERAGALEDTVVLCISADLPFAQARFCGAEGLSNVVNLSLMRGRAFAKDYGVEIANGPMAGLTARAVVVLDKHNKVLHLRAGGRNRQRAELRRRAQGFWADDGKADLRNLPPGPPRRYAHRAGGAGGGARAAAPRRRRRRCLRCPSCRRCAITHACHSATSASTRTSIRWAAAP